MKPRSVLAVTATAGPRVIQDISNTLGIQSDALSQNESMGDKDNILVIDRPRENIAVSCQFVETHEERLEMVSRSTSHSRMLCHDKRSYNSH